MVRTILNEDDIEKGRSRLRSSAAMITGLRSSAATSALGNFDEIREIVVRDSQAGVRDVQERGPRLLSMSTSRVSGLEELNFDRVQRGLIQKAKVFTNAPVGTQAWQSILGRPHGTISGCVKRYPLLEQTAFHREDFLQGAGAPELVLSAGIYENPNNPKNPYDPQPALKLLSEAGYQRDASGTAGQEWAATCHMR